MTDTAFNGMAGSLSRRVHGPCADRPLNALAGGAAEAAAMRVDTDLSICRYARAFAVRLL